jgi:hypothetical protein
MTLYLTAARKTFMIAVAIASMLGSTSASAIGAGAAKPATPMIQSVAPDLKQGRLVISGQYFGGTAPTVRLGNLILEVKSASPNMIVAKLPDGIRPATYGLTVTINDGARVAVSDVFHAALF